jgi:hypothetical protein
MTLRGLLRIVNEIMFAPYSAMVFNGAVFWTIVLWWVSSILFCRLEGLHPHNGQATNISNIDSNLVRIFDSMDSVNLCGVIDIFWIADLGAKND